MAFWKGRGWHVEDVRAIGPNLVAGTIAHGARRRAVIGVYVPPSEVSLETTEMLTREVERLGVNKNVVVLGDLNVNRARPRDERQRAIIEEMAALQLVDAAGHFRHRQRGREHWFT